VVQKFLSSRFLSKNIKIKIYFTVLPFVLRGCETRSLKLREEHRLRVFENRVPRRIFGRKGHEPTEGWRKCYNEELHSLYSLPNMPVIRMTKSRRIKWTGHVVRMGKIRNAYKIFIRKPKGKRPLGRPRRRSKDNIKTDLWEIVLEDVIGFIWLRIGTCGEL
jgi:hypothetical protein